MLGSSLKNEGSEDTESVTSNTTELIPNEDGGESVMFSYEYEYENEYD